jgi:GT2 family glycosyltransferase
MKLSIIIVSWNVKQLLHECLQSLSSNEQGIELEIIVVDNNSTDGSAAMVQTEFPQVILLPQESNVGFAKANNLGLRRATGDYFLLLNPDTMVPTGSLRPMVDYLQAHSEVGIVGPHIVNPDGTTQASVRGNPTGLNQLFVLLKQINVMPWLPSLRSYLRRDFDYSQTQSVDQLMGAALMFPRSLTTVVGFLDEQFFLWFEEVDLCLRTKQAGLDIIYLATSQITHHGGASFGQRLTLDKQKIFNQSLIAYLRKHRSESELSMIQFFLPMNMFLTWLYSLVKR